MDEFFSGMDGIVRLSITESTMMRILHSAMNKAQEKVKSKDGVLERLSERSKFCELAIMQLDGCLKFVQEETDSSILERNHGNVLSDLTEIRDRLQRRLKETELAISRKDRELTERLENELKLRQALEEKETELVSLRANIELERTKSEGVQEFLMGNPLSGDEGRDSEFCELKHSVDQQFWNIKQKLEDEKINLSKVNQSPSNSVKSPSNSVRSPSNSVNLELDSEVLEETKENVENKEIEPCEEDQESESKTPTYSLLSEINMGIEQMDSDIDILKETFDLAFGRMQNAIDLSEQGPMEKQWRLTIEKDTICVLIEGFVRDLPQKFEAEVRKREKQLSAGLMGEHWSDLMNEIIVLRRELELLGSENEFQVISAKDQSKISQKTRGLPLPEGDSSSVSANSSLQLEKAQLMEELPADDPARDGSHFVLKMIQNHESIIRKKTEELNWLRGEILRGKNSSLNKKEKDSDYPKRRINEVIGRLNCIIGWNNKLGKTFGDCGDTQEKENFPGKRLSKSDIYDQEKTSSDTMADLLEQVSNVSVFQSAFAELHFEIERLKQENEDLNLQSMILEETYAILFVGLMEASYAELYNYDIESLIREDVFKDFFKEMFKEWNEITDSNKMETQIREEVGYIIFKEAMKGLGLTSAKNVLFCNLEGMIREDVCVVLLRETVQECKKRLESNNTESIVREEINQIVLDETVKDIVNTANSMFRQYQEVVVSDNCDFPLASGLSESLESLVKEDVYMVFFREMVKAWKMEIEAYNIECLIGEEIFQFLIVKAVKDAYFLSRELKASNKDNYPEDLFPADKSPEVGGEESLIQKLDFLLQCFEVEEDLMITASSETEEHNAFPDLVGLEIEELGCNIFEELQIEDECTFCSVSSKLEKALQQLVLSKALLSELGSGLDMAGGDDQENVHDQSMQQSRDHSFCQANENALVQLNPSDSMFSPLTEFPQVFVDFEHKIHDKLEINNMRLEEAKRQLDPFVELAASLRKKESVYRKAFLSRCQNLQKAETEVDLLGDQVDVLLGLLEKIYMTLHYYAPVLQCHFEVSDILKSIERELTGVVAEQNQVTCNRDHC